MLSLNISSLSVYKRLVLIFVLGICLAIGLGEHFLRERINNYAITSTQELLGDRSLAPEQEQVIRATAQRMNITQPFHIRRMNSTALMRFGYHNAFAYWPQCFGFIPLGHDAFMYVSEGFFEDLSPEEQEFLIGHELAHIHEHHTRYLQLFVFFVIIAITLAALWIRRKIKNYFEFLIPSHSKQVLWGFTLLIWLICMGLSDIVGYAYYRHMERVADFQSLQKLNSYDGFLKLSDRWLKEYKMQLHNDYLGIFSDHPSVAERKQYCLALQKQNRRA